MAAVRQQAEQRANHIQQQRIMLAHTCRETADQAVQDEHVAVAVLNYRRAATFAPSSEDGQAAARAIGVLQKNAEAELQEVDRLVAAQQFDQAILSLNELRHDYSALSIAPKIEQTRRRALRLLEASGRVATVEPRLRSDRAQRDLATDRVAELAQPRDTRPPIGGDRGTLAAIRKLAEQTGDDSSGSRLRGSEPRR